MFEFIDVKADPVDRDMVIVANQFPWPLSLALADAARFEDWNSLNKAVQDQLSRGMRMYFIS